MTLLPKRMAQYLPLVYINPSITLLSSSRLCLSCCAFHVPEIDTYYMSAALRAMMDIVEVLRESYMRMRSTILYNVFSAPLFPHSVL